MHYTYFLHIHFSNSFSLAVTKIILVKQIVIFLCSLHKSYLVYAIGRCLPNSMITYYWMILSSLIDPIETTFVNPLNYLGTT